MVEKAWRRWAQDAFLGGARQAHASPKARAQQEILPSDGEAQPHVMAEQTLSHWQTIWNTHGNSA
eukprot:7879697-Pyramimonas_sp.AAC.1